MAPSPKHLRQPLSRPEHRRGRTDSFPVLVRPQPALARLPEPLAALPQLTARPDISSKSSLSPHFPDTESDKNTEPCCRPAGRRRQWSSDCSSCRSEPAPPAFPSARTPPPVAVAPFPAAKNRSYHPHGNTLGAAATCSLSQTPRRRSTSNHSAGTPPRAKAR